MSCQASIRAFRPEDRDQVMALATRLAEGVAAWRSPGAAQAATRAWLAASIASAANDRHAVFVAEHKGVVVGVVTVQERPHWTGEADGYVGELVTARGHEGQGVGSALLGAAEEWAAKRGLRCLTLDVGAANSRARRLYARLGYRTEEIRVTKILSPSSA